MSRFIKFKPHSDLFNQMIKSGKHKEFVVLSLIAARARRTDDPVTGLKSGESMIGDYDSFGLTRQQYRTAIKNLKTWGVIATKPTTKGTITKLLDSSVYDINEEEANQQLTNSQPSSNQQLTTNKNVKKEKNVKNEKRAGALDLSNLPDGISEQTAKDFIEHRKLIKKPLTQRALNTCMAIAAKAPGHSLTPEQVIDETITRGWMKPEPEWVANSLSKQQPGNVTQFRRPEQENRPYREAMPRPDRAPQRPTGTGGDV